MSSKKRYPTNDEETIRHISKHQRWVKDYTSCNPNAPINDKKRRDDLAKRKSNHKPVINFNEAKDNALKYKRATKVELIPRNTAQETYVEQLLNYETRITIALGPAGTGKTLLATLRAIKALKDREVDRIVVTRPAVSVDEQHGFLPGDLNKKMEPWTRPIFDIFEEFWTPMEIDRMLADRIIEISPLAFMRGRTFKHCYIVADEMQNATPEQMKMLLTRIGTGSQMGVTGDLKQHDRGFEKNGLKDFVSKLNCDIAGIGVCEFERKHVERDPIVEAVLGVYGED